MTTIPLSIESIFTKATSLRILVVGDLMLDKYLWGKADRISPEAPVQVVEVLHEEMRLGGAGNVVNNLMALGVQVDICSVVGNDDVAKIIIQEFGNLRISREAIFPDPGRQTTSKTRLLASNQQIVRIDRETITPISQSLEKNITDWILLNIENHNVVILSDYGKGVLTFDLIGYVIKLAKEKHIPILVDPKGGDFKRYFGATVLTPNRREIEIASKMLIKNNEDLYTAAKKIMDGCNLENLLITRSDEGMSLFLKDGQ
ncbi:MAG: PfkB family carbohydrate kinase, partial [Holophaga sp.]|nr:PfkB family carbohydrate kinase [Holophaga sp.]